MTYDLLAFSYVLLLFWYINEIVFIYYLNTPIICAKHQLLLLGIIFLLIFFAISLYVSHGPLRGY